MFKKFTEKINYVFMPTAGRIENIGQFQMLGNLIKHELSSDQELLKLHKNRISDDCYYDENLNILTQDFIYAVVVHLESQANIPQKTFELTMPRSLNSYEVVLRDTDIDFTPRIINHLQNTIENSRIGDLGELWVIQFEKRKLEKANLKRLAEKVKHVAKDNGDGLGYDILSYDSNGNEIYIEVKTTKGNRNSTFYITRNELERSKLEKDNYHLYRVYLFDEKSERAELLIIKGDLSKLCEIPLTYKVNIKLS